MEVSLNNEFSQQCTLEVTLNEDDSCQNNNPSITLFYRLPNSLVENNEDFLELLDNMSNNTLIVSDLNMPGIDWLANISDNKGQNILDAVVKCALDQLVRFPTHSRGNLLDVVFAPKGHSIYNVENIGNIGNSDYTTILFDIITESDPKYENKYVYDWTKGDQNSLDTYLCSVQWQNVLSDCSPEQAWGEFDSIIQAGITRYIPF